MDPQEITKIVKAVLIVAGLSGKQISPEYQQAIVEGALYLYAALAMVESWAKRRIRKKRPSHADQATIAAAIDLVITPQRDARQ